MNIRGFTCLALVALLALAGAAAADDYLLVSRRDGNPGYSYFPSPSDWRDVNIYQIFTDRFYDGDPNNNTTTAAGIDRTGWYVYDRAYPQNRNFHHGGDWKGLRDKLDYLSDMGVNAIWMSGVQMNAQGRDLNYTPYHMYHPTDFWRVDPAQGTFQELKDLIDACHARGIYVILDVVVNHMADLAGIPGTDDKWYWPNGRSDYNWWDGGRKHRAPFDRLDWFHNNGTINCWDCYPETLLGQFKGTDDLATDRADVQNELDLAFKNLISATDCDGFRVDAIKHVAYDWIKKWADDMRKHAASIGKSDFILFGEYFSYDNNALASYCKDEGYSFNSALFFPMQQTMKGVFVQGAWTGWLTQSLNAKNGYGEGANRLVAFLDNHDVNRIGLEMGGDVGNVTWRMKPALTFLYTATPVPCLFYGTEHAFNQGGHWNGSSAGPDNDDADHQRECMFDRGFQPGPAWGDKINAPRSDLYNHIAALNAARAAHPSLTRGSFSERWQEGSAGAYAYSRKYGEEESLVAFNTSESGRSINPSVDKPDGTEFTNVLNPSEKVTSSGGKISFSLDGKASKIFVAGSSAPKPWVGNTRHWPIAGEIASTNDVWIDVESYPKGLLTNGIVTYDVNGADTWPTVALVTNGQSANNDLWHVNLGSFPAGATVEFAVMLSDGTNDVWDSNDGNNYSFTVNAGAAPWVGDTYHWPTQGAIYPESALWINTSTMPKGDITNAVIVYNVNAATEWQTTNMNFNSEWSGGDPSADWWNINLGTFPAGTVVKYAIVAKATEQREVWDNNNGQDYYVSVNRFADGLVVITDPEDGTEVATAVTTQNVSGVCDASVTGDLVWSNAANGQSGSIAAAGTWTIVGVPLAAGTNVISVLASNVSSVEATLAADTAANAAYGDGWTTGDDGGTGFVGWTISAPVDGHSGSFIGAGVSDIGAMAWGLWANDSNLSEAFRSFDETMAVGDTFRVKMDNGGVDGVGAYGSSVGVALQSSAGDTLFEFFFVGGESKYHYRDGSAIRTSSVDWTSSGMDIEFVLTGTSTYSVTVSPYGGSPAILSGSLNDSGNRQISRFRAWNFNSGVSGENNDARNFFFNDLELVRAAQSGVVNTATVAVIRSGEADDNTNGIPDSWENYYSFYTSTNRASADPDEDGMSNEEEYIAGTNPTDGESLLELDIRHIRGTGLVIEWPVDFAGRHYEVLRSTAVDGTYQLIATGIIGETPLGSYTDTAAEAINLGAFYMIRARLRE